MENETPRIRVLIADDHHLARLGIAGLIETAPELELVGQAKDGAEALDLYRKLLPDVVLVDLKMPKVDGVALIGMLMQETPPGQCVVLSQLEGDEAVFRAIKAGALGYVTKDAEGEEVLTSIRSAAQGRRFVPGEIGAKLAARMAGEVLSLRELQVLRLLADGQSNKGAAASLKLSERTVAVHVAHIFEKLGVKNRAEAVSAALKRNIL